MKSTNDEWYPAHHLHAEDLAAARDAAGSSVCVTCYVHYHREKHARPAEYSGFEVSSR